MPLRRHPNFTRTHLPACREGCAVAEGGAKSTPGEMQRENTRRHSDGAWARGRKQPRPHTCEKIALSLEDTVEL